MRASVVADPAGHTVAWRCAVCGAIVDIATPLSWRCPNASTVDPHHVLHPVTGDHPIDAIDDPNPFVRFGPRLAWWSFARANGMLNVDCVALTREVASGFTVTPWGRNDALSTALGREIWVKDETGQLAGSHKGRHLVTILLHLRAAEELGLLTSRPPLAIASCGNAAVAAATLASRIDWPIRVFVPEWMDPAYRPLLESIGAELCVSVRRVDDPPGDPAVLRFREAVAAGAIPFSVQGPENAWCLDGGRTIGWELAADPPDDLVVQVGGGAFATCIGAALGPGVRLFAAQAEGCAPLARAWERAAGLEHPERGWSDLMTPWASPTSAADGILDDETYDWLGVFEAMRTSGGRPVVVAEEHVLQANELARQAGIPASVTGSAGLAGVLQLGAELDPGRRVGVVMSGLVR
jgi:threonine synthase